MYLIQSPVSLYLWLGQEVDNRLKHGSLRIMSSFMINLLHENFQYKPGYSQGVDIEKEQNILTMRLRIEYQGYESVKFKQLLGSLNSPPQGWEDRTDYLMMRRQKVNLIEEAD